MVGLAYQRSFAQVALTLRRFAFQDMAFKSFGALELTASGDTKTFGSASTSFDFRHYLLPLAVVSVLCLLLFGIQNHNHVLAFQFGLAFYIGDISQFLGHTHKQNPP